MDGAAVLTWIGTIASVAGALFAFTQADKARDAADEAQRVKNSLIDRRKAAELTQLHTACSHVVRAMSKFGPSATPASLAGLSTALDAREVQDFLVAVREQRAHFDAKQPNEADVLFEKAARLLEEFAKAESPESMCDSGGQLFMLLNGFLPVIKRQEDARREAVL